MTTGTLDTTVFQKPFNKYLYLPPTSYHNKSTFTTLIHSELKRYRIICSNDAAFNTIKQQFRERLLQRGYANDTLDTIMNITVDRTTLLTTYTQNKHNNHSTIQSTAPLIFKTYRTPRQRLLNLKQCLQPDEYVWCDPNSRTIFNSTNNSTIIACKRTNNLKDILTSSTHKYTIQNGSTMNNNSPTEKLIKVWGGHPINEL